MESIVVFGPERFSLRPDREKVFGWLGLDRNLPCREAFERAWPAAEAALAASAQPQAATARGADGTLTVFLTLGPQPEARMTAFNRDREYVAGSLLNTMSDELLFRMNRQAASLIGAMLRPEQLYAHSRLEPGVALTASVQREKLRPIQRVLPFARISETGVLYPTKSMMYVIVLSDEPCHMHALHDCAACDQKDCAYRDAPPGDSRHGAP